MNVTKLITLAGIAAAAAIAVPATAHADTPGVFLSPSGNIICSLYGAEDGTSSVNCEIQTYSYTPPQAKPADCFVGWGDRVRLEEGDAAVLSCHGDSAFGMAQGAAVLPYGQSRSSGTITCTSRTTGMTCKDSSTGAYFTVSRQALTLG